MNKSKKVELLYMKARGKQISVSSDEAKELRKYKIGFNEGDFYTTKANIRDYVTAVDNGYRLSFCDWCFNHGKADKRRKGSSAKEIAKKNNEMGLSAMFLGWLPWGMALYWMTGGGLSVGESVVGAVIISFILSKCTRKWAFMTLFILPLMLAVLFGR